MPCHQPNIFSRIVAMMPTGSGKPCKTKGSSPVFRRGKNRKRMIEYDTVLYKQRHKVENMFGKLKDWRRVATRYDRCAHTFFSAICIAASVIFYLNQ